MNSDLSPVDRAERRLAWTLRLFGATDCLALIAVLLPPAAMDAIARNVGLDGVPAGPLTGYLARSASLMYALHGGLVLFVSCDVRTYAQLIRFLALLAIAHGGVLLAIDVAQAMPLWWRCVEGPAVALTGVTTLFLQSQIRQSQIAAPPPPPPGRDRMEGKGEMR